jgi:predicted amidohydrolase YtcJ
MAALREHHEPEQVLTADQALHVHTVGSRALAAERDGSGEVVPGAPADLVWLDRDPLRVDPDELLKTEVLGTWRGGRLVWPEREEIA